MKRKLTKLITLVFILATALAGAASVLAAPGSRPTTGDLTIHKYWAETSSDIGSEGDGEAETIDTDKNPPVKGIQFDVYQLTPKDAAPDTPPSDKDGWSYSRVGAELTVKKDAVEHKYALTPKNSDNGANGKTGTDGALKYTDLDAGYYYVEENLAASAGYEVQVADNKVITSPAKPFIWRSQW